MPRAFLLILDSFGIGGAPDAASFGDEGSNTLCHICDHMKLRVPHMASLGLGKAAALSAGRDPLGPHPLIGQYGVAREVSRGKDTVTGHWEIAGVPLAFDWGYFPHTVPAFPPELIEGIVRGAKLPGLLALCHASGTQVIEDFGEEHIRTAKPIAYTSADSVLQIAAHERHFGLERLYEVCRVARELTYPMNIGRVIARPFLGERRGEFRRTGHRRDFAVPPPAPTLLKVLSDAGRDVVSVGKIGDIYAHAGTGREIKVAGNPALLEATLANMDGLSDGGLLMTNFVDFDTECGHRRDPEGYGRLLEAFDAELPRILARLRDGDLLILTADHGNDPTWKGADHTREQIPVMSCMRGMAPGSFGLRTSFADIGQTIARRLGVGPLAAGTAWDIANPAA
ncbi:phosphopentomutase [Aestuariivirga sp.]|uniref:phosphopentomutase n=1 Tax=Aestuariivirga sp. TaxID=2650926 RepID=UPI0025BC5AF9|nr:phosphopentomutase [Aestuariivirga sp.]MCA3553969.1 phosphopentomutase [Aestuariivirga sp.]